jgi:hypothetical protein
MAVWFHAELLDVLAAKTLRKSRWKQVTHSVDHWNFRGV